MYLGMCTDIDMCITMINLARANPFSLCTDMPTDMCVGMSMGMCMGMCMA